MGKMLRLLALGGVIAAPLSAQTTFGVVGGLVSATWSANPAPVDDEHLRSITGFAIGVSIATPITKTLDLAPEVLYAKKGATDTNETSVAVVQERIAYVEVPVLLRYALATSGDARPFLLAGPEISFKAGCSISFQGQSSSDCGDSGLKSSDYGFILGVGISYQRFSASVRYDLGLANIAANATDGSSLKNGALLILVGVHF